MNSESGNGCKAQFDEWLNDLFKEDRERVTDEKLQSQNDKARRLSLGGTSSKVFMRGKIANEKVIRRQRSLPDIRRNMLVGTKIETDILGRDLKQEALDREEKEKHLLEKLKYRKVKWSSERKLDIPVVSSATEHASFTNVNYKHVYYRLNNEGENLLALEPGVLFQPLIAKGLGLMMKRKKHDEKRLVIPPCLILGASSKLTKQCDIEGISLGEENKLDTYRPRELHDKLDGILNGLFNFDAQDGFPVAVGKRTHFDRRSKRGFQGAHSSLIFLYNKEQIMNEIQRNSEGVLGLQKFVKAKGGRPWIVRAHWDAKNGCKKVWVLTSTSEYARQPTNVDATKIGQMWIPSEIPSALESTRSSTSNNSQQTTTTTLGNLHPLHGKAKETYYVHQLGTDTRAQSRCNVVQAHAGVWPVPTKATIDLASAIQRASKMELEEMVVDYIQDENENWWILQVKSFQLKSTTASRLEQVDVGLGDASVILEVVQPLIHSINRKPSLKRTMSTPSIAVEQQQPQLQPEHENRPNQCFGDYCNARSQMQTREMYEMKKRVVYLDRATVRAWDIARKKGEAILPELSEEELEQYLTTKEVNTQFETVQVCQACNAVYCRGVEKRLLVQERKAKIEEQAQAKTDKACLRLYARFEQAKQEKLANFVFKVNVQEKKPTKAKRARKKYIPKPIGEDEAQESFDLHDFSFLNRDEEDQQQQQQHSFLDQDVLGDDEYLETQSISSILSFAPGDRVVDRILGAGTVVDFNRFDQSCAIQFDSGAIEGSIDHERLHLVDEQQHQQQRSGFLRLSADELIGVGPLPPQLNNDFGQEADPSSPTMAPIEETRLVPNIVPSSKDGISKEFADMFLSDDDDGEENHDERQQEEASNTLPPINNHHNGKSGVLCPFGCGSRLIGDGTLSGSHDAWLAHMNACPNRRKTQKPGKSLPFASPGKSFQKHKSKSKSKSKSKRGIGLVQAKLR